MASKSLMLLTLALLCSHASALPSIVPTRTVKPGWTTVHEARARSSTATTTTVVVHLTGAQAVAVEVCSVLAFAALLAFGIAMKCGWRCTWNAPRAALARRSRGRKPPTLARAPALAVPTTEALTHAAPTTVNAAQRGHHPVYDKLDGWAPPPLLNEPSHRVDSSSSVSKSPHTAEAPRHVASSESHSHVEHNEVTEPAPPAYSGKAAASDSWKQGTTTAEDSEGWKHG
ncbi:hypothetical protein FRB90_009482 [Tulasnella sp. 427]|nr:hypothetical protein FRB90_009482 [Tulasnella sp. 427]